MNCLNLLEWEKSAARNRQGKRSRSAERQSTLRFTLLSPSLLYFAVFNWHINRSLSKSESDDKDFESEEDDSNPFPLEGKFIDEADRFKYGARFSLLPFSSLTCASNSFYR